MSDSRAVRYVCWCSLTALVMALPLVPLAVGRGAAIVAWGGIGWSVAAIAGVACGARLTAVHGREGTAFLVNFGACMLARLIAYASGAAAAAAALGKEGVFAYLAGVLGAYLPTQIFEMAWFARATLRT